MKQSLNSQPQISILNLDKYLTPNQAMGDNHPNMTIPWRPK